MPSDAEELAQRNQEQAVAAWVNHLNQVRIDTLLSALSRQDENLRDALASIDCAMRTIEREVVARNRGGVKGMHGFIAEVAEVGVGNARSQILGEQPGNEWINDNGAVDLRRQGVDIQQKFRAARLGLPAVAAHLDKYPDFVANGAKYQLPADQFEVIERLHAMSREDAYALLTRGGDGPSPRDWERVHDFFEKHAIGIDALEPSHLEYHEVQRDAVGAVLESEKDSLRATDQSERNAAYQDSRPTLQEGVQATVVAAGVEGATAFVLAVVVKRREGKQLRQFTNDDWLEIAGETGFGAVRGGARGLSIYSLTNFTATSAAVASSIVTASFGVAEQANRFRRGELDEVAFIENAELVCLDAAVSALSSFVGQALIPVPVLGAVIGNTVGTVMAKAAKDTLSKREAELVERYCAEQTRLDERLSAELRDLIDTLEASMTRYLGVLDQAFSPDVEIAFLGSVDLALELGVMSEDVLDSDEKVAAYFLE